MYVISIKQGNILFEVNADFIVNPSNTMLMLGTGVSMAFKNHCGIELQKTMNEILAGFHAKGYRLKKGDVIPSGPGMADNFKYILHAAIMDYNPGVYFNDKAPDLNDIICCLSNIQNIIIEYAKTNDKNNVNLILPLMGCGHGGLKMFDVIKLYENFFRLQDIGPYITCNVIIYGYRENDYKLLLEAISDD